MIADAPCHRSAAGDQRGTTVTAVLAGVPVGTGHPVRLMAVVNVSPESFYSGSVRGDATALREAVQRATEEGADFIDIGAMSTAPYLKTAIPVAEEVRRMTWALDIARNATSVPLSADTSRATVAAAAIASGARVINDVTGLRSDPAMADVAAQGEGVVLTASQVEETVGDPLAVVSALLADSLDRARRAGIPEQEIVLDPGIGFFPRGGSLATKFPIAVLRRLQHLRDLRRPLLVGVSRKSFIGCLTDAAEPGDRLNGSLGATAIAVYNGADLVRTHDVAATRDVVLVAAALRDG